MDSAPLGIGGRLNHDAVTAHWRTGWDDRPDSAVDDGEGPVESGKAAAPPSPSRLGTAAASASGPATAPVTPAPAPAAQPPPAQSLAPQPPAPQPPAPPARPSAPTGNGHRPTPGNGRSAGTTTSGGFSQRLRSMLPWPATNDPVGALIRSHRSIHASGDPSLLRRAYGIAEQMHRGQVRKSGEPYITHPLAVAQILADLGMDTTTLVAALLHDTVEDTSYTLPQLENDFGPEVTLLVDGVTKFDKGFFGADAEVETIRKMLVKAGQDVRVLVIKLADRLHNMRTLDARSPASRARIARATRDMLVPLCDRLGIQALKRDLEDCVLKALSPSGHAL